MTSIESPQVGSRPRERSRAGSFVAAVGPRATARKTRDLLEMIRFSHTIFALPFALLAAVMAWLQTAADMTKVVGPKNIWEAIQGKIVTVVQPTLGEFVRPRDAIGILLAMVTAHSAAMAFNRLVDRHLDAQNPRTARRHLPTGVLGVRSVAIFATIASLAFIASTLLFLPNRLPLYLAPPILLFLLSYSFAKRFTVWSHVWLGAALMLSPISAWIALRGDAVYVHPADLLPALALGGAVLLWVTGFDIIYACQDVEFDRDVGLKSVPALFGVRAALTIAAVCHLGMVALLYSLMWLNHDLGAIYGWGVGAVTALLVYEHWLVRPDDLSRVNRAFFNVNAIVSVWLLVITTYDLLV